MLAHGHRQDACLPERRAPVQMQLVDEPPVEQRQFRIAGKLDDAVVEGDVRIVIAVDVAARDGPRDTPSIEATSVSRSCAPAGRSPARIMRSSSRWTSAGSELVWISAI